VADQPVGPLDSLRYPRYAGIRTFARLPTLEQAGRADVAILGAPYDGATSFRPGARFGPSAIREASVLLRPYNEPLRMAPFAEAQVADAGDAGPDPIDVGAAHAAIQAAAGDLHAAGARVLGLGGDHSVALPFLRAAAERHGTLSLLQLDAHTDTWDEYYGHKVTHGTIMRRAAEEGVIDPRASLQVGLRGPLYAETDLEENAELGFNTVLAREFELERVVGAIGATLRPPVYVSFDIDCLDPAHAPGTGTPEAGGLTSREALSVLRSLVALDIVSADLVEVSPPYDPAGVTANAAAAIAYDLLSLLVRSSRR